MRSGRRRVRPGHEYVCKGDGSQLPRCVRLAPADIGLPPWHGKSAARGDPLPGAIRTPDLREPLIRLCAKVRRQMRQPGQKTQMPDVWQEPNRRNLFATTGNAMQTGRLFNCIQPLIVAVPNTCYKSATQLLHDCDARPRGTTRNTRPAYPEKPATVPTASPHSLAIGRPSEVRATGRQQRVMIPYNSRCFGAFGPGKTCNFDDPGVPPGRTCPARLGHPAIARPDA